MFVGCQLFFWQDPLDFCLGIIQKQIKIIQELFGFQKLVGDPCEKTEDLGLSLPVVTKAYSCYSSAPSDDLCPSEDLCPAAAPLPSSHPTPLPDVQKLP